MSIVLGAAACASDGTDGETAAEATTTTSAAVTTAPATTAASSGETATCVDPPAQAAAIQQGLTVTGGGTLVNARAVALGEPQASFTHVIAADIDGEGLEGDGDIGVWATGTMTGAGPITAINAVAREFSDWGAAAQPGSAADDLRVAISRRAEVAAVVRCVESL